jgi:hypothetical protein
MTGLRRILKDKSLRLNARPRPAPAVVARMASTIDSIAPGRFGINIVTGWQMAEYDQMGMWPGNDYFGFVDRNVVFHFLKGERCLMMAE